MGAVTEDAFCLKWNDFHTSVTSSFAELRDESDLLDATVVCEGQTVRAHKLVLSACSGVFRQLFRSSSSALGLPSTDHHPVILLWDVKADDLRLLFNFMYEGQVNVAQERLSTFLALAERLQVRGLTSTTGEGVINRTGVVAAVKSIVPLVTPSVPVPVVASSIPVVAAHGGGKRGQRALMGSHQHAAMKRGRGMGDHRDVNDVGNAVIKQEIKVDGETAYAAVSANSIHATQYQPGQQQVFGQYYETATSGNGENDTHGTTTTTFATADGNVIVGTATAAAVAAAAAAAAGQSGPMGELGVPQGGGVVPVSNAPSNNASSGGTTSTTTRSPHHHNTGGICTICNKPFRQLRSHMQDVHNPTPTPCPLCGKVFSSKHKMFGHKYRSCPNRTRNLVRHLQDIEQVTGQPNQQQGQQQQQQQAQQQQQQQQQPQQAQQQQQEAAHHAHQQQAF